VNEVRYLCERLLEPAPPLREASDVLAVARRSTARQHRRTAAGVAVVAAVSGAAALGVPILAAHQAAPGSRGAAAAPVAAASPGEPRSSAAPPRTGTYGDTMLDLIRSALPPGYTIRSQYPAVAPSAGATSLTPSRPSGGAGLVSSLVNAIASMGGGDGWLSLTARHEGLPAPAGDLCSPAVARRMGEQPGTECKVITVNGTPIRVAREHWSNTSPEIDVIVATRYINKVSLSLVESRSVPHFRSDKTPTPPDASKGDPRRQATTSALDEWFLSEDQLAGLVANPAMLRR
jgi:hypothetical protein